MLLKLGITLSILSWFVIAISPMIKTDTRQTVNYIAGINMLWIGVVLSFIHYLHCVIIGRGMVFSEVKLYLVHAGVFSIAVVINLVVVKLMARQGVINHKLV